MTTVPLGQGAYERKTAGVPEVVLQNRWAESAPTNLREHMLLLSRPGTAALLAANALSAAGFTGQGPLRGLYYFGGLFNDALFVVCGQNLYRIDTNLAVTHILGVVNGTGHPELAWMKGAGYQFLFMADGLLLQFYSGTTPAKGTLTFNATPVAGVDVFQVGGVYYGWGTGFSSSDAGTAAHPFLINPKNAQGATAPEAQLVLAIMDSGTPGVDYSSTIGGHNTLVTAASNEPGANTVTLTSIATNLGANSISTTVTAGTAMSFGGATLTGGGVDALQGVTMPNGLAAQSLSQVSGYVQVSVANAQQFYWVNPGEIVVDPLNFASKESSPDNIVAMRCTGDQVLIMGESSTENWYATGDLAAPFAPIEGRVYQRGAIQGTPCIVDESVMLVGDDGVAYEIGYSFGTGADWGVHRISNHGIEERIRRQIRREAGLTP